MFSRRANNENNGRRVEDGQWGSRSNGAAAATPAEGYGRTRSRDNAVNGDRANNDTARVDPRRGTANNDSFFNGRHVESNSFIRSAFPRPRCRGFRRWSFTRRSLSPILDKIEAALLLIAEGLAIRESTREEERGSLSLSLSPLSLSFFVDLESHRGNVSLRFYGTIFENARACPSIVMKRRNFATKAPFSSVYGDATLSCNETIKMESARLLH